VVTNRLHAQDYKYQMTHTLLIHILNKLVPRGKTAYALMCKSDKMHNCKLTSLCAIMKL